MNGMLNEKLEKCYEQMTVARTQVRSNIVTVQSKGHSGLWYTDFGQEATEIQTLLGSEGC